MDIKKILSDHAAWLRGEGGFPADLSRADLSRANLTFINLSHANLRCANLRRANLRRANLSYADLISADLSGANLRGANFRGANLISADLSGANLIGANFRSADLSHANLSGADLRNAVGDGDRIKTLLVGKYIVTWHADFVCIGCNLCTLAELEALDENDIPDEDRHLWRAHKDWIIETVKRFPAE